MIRRRRLAARRVFACDSYDLDPSQPAELDSPHHPATLSRVLQTFEFFGFSARSASPHASSQAAPDDMNPPRVEVVSGPFAETLPSLGCRHVALLHIAADSFDATLQVHVLRMREVLRGNGCSCVEACDV